MLILKKISIDDAAKKLGVSKVVIQEWADFLEEENILSIDYKFSKTFLIERKLTQKEIKVKEKEYSTQKDAFVRKVETSLKHLDSDSIGLEKIKKEFDILRKEIGDEIGQVQEEVKQLENYEYLKKNLDKDIQKQINDFHTVLDKAHKEILYEEKRHQDLLDELEVEKKDVKAKEQRLLSLEEKEENLMERIEEIVEISKDLSRRISTEKLSITASEKKAANLEQTIKEISDNITKKKLELQPLLDKAKKHEDKIVKLQDDILKKAKEKTMAIKTQVDESVKATTKFKKFFDRRKTVTNLISKIDSEKKELEADFKTLQKKVLAFDLSTKSNIVKSHVGGLEKQFTKISDKKSVLKQDLEKLVKLVKG